MNPFQIKGRDIKKRNVGTTEKPHLYAITARFNLPDYCAKFGTASPNLELIVSSDENNTLHITMEQTFYGPELEPESLETVTVPKTGNLLRVL